MGTWIEARPSLVVPGVIDTYEDDEAHITLAYLGDADPAVVLEMMRDTSTKKYLPGIWPTHKPLICEISGSAQWRDASNKLFRVLLVQPSIAVNSDYDIYNERNLLVAKFQALSGEDDYPEVEVDRTYPFLPHITLPDRWQVNAQGVRGTAHPVLSLPMPHSRVMFTIDKLYVSHTTDDGSYHNELI